MDYIIRRNLDGTFRLKVPMPGNPGRSFWLVNSLTSSIATFKTLPEIFEQIECYELDRFPPPSATPKKEGEGHGTPP